MLLKDVLNVFDDYLNSFIEGIEYFDAKSYELTLYIHDEDDIAVTTGLKVHLYDDGSLSLWFINERDGTTYVPYNVINSITILKKQWNDWCKEHKDE
jgi:hypothetical protein